MPGTDTRRTRLARLGLMFAAHAMGTANISLALAFAPLLQRELGLTPAAFGLAVSCYYATQVIAALPAGWLVDRFGIRRALVTAHVVLAAGMAMIALSRGAWLLSAGLATCGLGYVLINPSTARGVLAWFDIRHRATAMGVKQTGVPVGAVVIAMLAALVSEWRLFAFALAASMLLMTVPFFAALSREPTAASRSTLLRDLKRAVGCGRLTAVTLGTGLYTTAFGAVLAYFVTFSYEVVGVSMAVASMFLALVQGAAAVGRVAWGVAGDRLPGNGRVTGLLACGIVGAVATGVLPFVKDTPGLVAAAIVLGLTVGGFASLAQTLAVESVPRALAGAAIGYNMLLVTGGLMVGPALFALALTRGGYSSGWAAVSAVLVVGTLLFLAGSRMPLMPADEAGLGPARAP